MRFIFRKEFAAYIIIIAIIITLFLIYTFKVFSLRAMDTRLKTSLEKKTGILEKYNGMTQETLNILKEQQVSLNEKHKLLKDWIENTVSFADAADKTREPGLLFMKKHQEVWSRLKDLASAEEVKLPPTLGFPEDLPKNENVPNMLLQLELVQKLVSISVLSGVEQVVSINPLATRQEKESLSEFISHPVQLKLKGDVSAIFRFLYEIQKPLQFFRIKNLSISKSAKETLILNMLTDALIPVGETADVE